MRFLKFRKDARPKGVQKMIQDMNIIPAKGMRLSNSTKLIIVQPDWEHWQGRQEETGLMREVVRLNNLKHICTATICEIERDKKVAILGYDLCDGALEKIPYNLPIRNFLSKESRYIGCKKCCSLIGPRYEDELELQIRVLHLMRNQLLPRLPEASILNFSENTVPSLKKFGIVSIMEDFMGISEPKKGTEDVFTRFDKYKEPILIGFIQKPGMNTLSLSDFDARYLAPINKIQHDLQKMLEKLGSLMVLGPKKIGNS